MPPKENFTPIGKLYIKDEIGNIHVIDDNDLADEILDYPPKQGYLTISNALQWRLQYARVIALNNRVDGVINYEW